MSQQHPSGTRAVLPFYIALVSVAYISVGTITAIFSMLSSFYKDFHDPVRIGWIVSSYFLVSAIAAAICGRFGDLLGRRRVALLVLASTGTGALISAQAPNLDMLIAGCAIQGMAGAIPPLVLGMVREVFPAKKVPFAVGVIMATLVAGGGVSFMIAGLVVDRFSWSGGFLMSAMLAALAFLLLIALIPARRGTGEALGKVKLLPGLLFAPGIAAFFVANEMAHSHGWNDVRVIGLLLAAVLVLALWTRHQAHEKHPLINVRSLARRQVLLANICMAFLALGCMQNGQLLSLFFQQPAWTGAGFGFNAATSGMIMLPLLSVALVASPVSGAIAVRQGARQSALYGFLLGLAGWLWNTAYHASFWPFLAACLLGSLCVCLTQPAVYNLVIEATPEENTSEATGLTNIFISVFMAVGSQVLSLLLATASVSDPAHGAGTFPGDEAYTLTFAYISVMSVLGVVTALLLPRRPRLVAVASDKLQKRAA